MYIATPYGKGEEKQRKGEVRWGGGMGRGRGRGRGRGEREEIGDSNGCNIQYSVLSH